MYYQIISQRITTTDNHCTPFPGRGETAPPAGVRSERQREMNGTHGNDCHHIGWRLDYYFCERFGAVEILSRAKWLTETVKSHKLTSIRFGRLL